MAYSWGAYWTHYTPENAYVDALLLGSWYDIDAKSNRIDKLKTDGGAFGASLEGGYPVYTGPGGFSIEPQAQLAYQTVNLNNGSDVAAQVHFDNVNSLVGRVGVRFAQDFGTPTWLTGAPSTFTAWIRPNFWYEFLGDPKTKFSSATGFIPFAADMAARHSRSTPASQPTLVTALPSMPTHPISSASVNTPTATPTTANSASKLRGDCFGQSTRQ